MDDDQLKVIIDVQVANGTSSNVTQPELQLNRKRLAHVEYFQPLAV
jgi:hypothetical protein